MPLIDDQTRGTEQRSRPYWPWVLVVVGIAVLWLAIAALVSLVPRTFSGSTATSRVAASLSQQQQYHRGLVAQAQSTLGAGDAATASLLIDSIPADAPMEIMDKHTYLRTAAQVKRQSGNPAAAAGFYERFLSMGIRIGKPECQSCHGGPSAVAPNRVADLETSSIGADYVAALRAAGQLQSTGRRLRLQLKQQPTDLRLHVLLYHVEKELENSRAAAAHAEALRRLEAGS